MTMTPDHVWALFAAHALQGLLSSRPSRLREHAVTPDETRSAAEAADLMQRLYLDRFGYDGDASVSSAPPSPLTAPLLDDWDRESSPTIVGVAPPANPPTGSRA